MTSDLISRTFVSEVGQSWYCAYGVFIVCVRKELNCRDTQLVFGELENWWLVWEKPRLVSEMVVVDTVQRQAAALLCDLLVAALSVTAVMRTRRDSGLYVRLDIWERVQ